MPRLDVGFWIVCGFSCLAGTTERLRLVCPKQVSLQYSRLQNTRHVVFDRRRHFVLVSQYYTQGDG